jgi:lipopolysaccharide export LptBFGC system permease protein LptF
MEIDQVNLPLVVAILSIIILILIMFSQNSESKKLTPLAGLAFGFIVAGAIFGKNKFLGFGLFGTGIILSIIDIIIKNRKTGDEE